MAQCAVSDAEVIILAWEAEDRVRGGASCLARRRLARGRALSLSRFKVARRLVWCLVVDDRRGADVYDFADGAAAWRAAIGWDGKGEPEGFARYRRRA
jgi:hypothetical protein